MNNNQRFDISGKCVHSRTMLHPRSKTLHLLMCSWYRLVIIIVYLQIGTSQGDFGSCVINKFVIYMYMYVTTTNI